MQTAAKRVISYTLPWNDAPVDLSFVFAAEKPAGRHGFLQAKAGRLVFEDGCEARFWGTNFNSAANFPPHAHSEIVARRLAKFGVNLVRFHQMDGDWSTPNIFQFTKGPRLETTRRLDPESLDRLDYLIHCLKREGVYVYMDLLTYRKFRGADGAAAADQLAPMGSARPYTNFDPHLIELQKEFNEQLWTHVNPYTGLAYKDEPAIVLTEITNESQVFGFMEKMIEPYNSQLQARFRDWAAARKLSIADGPVDFTSNTPEILAFLLEIQKGYFDDMYRHMRSLGVRIPITGTNWCNRGVVAILAAQTDLDFTDSHTYWYGWSWKVADKRFNNNSMLGEIEPWFRPLSCMRVLDKPFFVSEWDDPWPNEWRAESTLWLAAVSCLQGWSGTAIHTYRYDCREQVDQIAAPITSDALAGVPYRSGIFDTFNDPAKFGLFYHAALMLRRGDVREAEEVLEVTVPGMAMRDVPGAPEHKKKDLIQVVNIAAAAGTVEACKLGLGLPGAAPLAERRMPMEQPFFPAGTTELRSCTGELYRNLQKKYGVIDSPRTKVAYGFLGGAGEIAMQGLTVKAASDFGVIAVSSLSDAPIAQADNLLLTAVGRADNSGAEYNAEHNVQFKLGHGPIQVEVIEARLEIETGVAGLQVWAINPAGMVIGRIPAELRDGKLRFHIGGEWPSMYYLIQKI